MHVDAAVFLRVSQQAKTSQSSLEASDESLSEPDAW